MYHKFAVPIKQKFPTFIWQNINDFFERYGTGNSVSIQSAAEKLETFW
jgi:hypothetical protein